MKIAQFKFNTINSFCSGVFLEVNRIPEFRVQETL